MPFEDSDDRLDALRQALDHRHRVSGERAAMAIAGDTRAAVRERAEAIPRQPGPEEALEWTTSLEEITATPVRAAADIAAHAGHDEAILLLQRMLRIVRDVPGDVLLDRYPALLIWYAAGVVLVARSRLGILRQLAVNTLLPRDRDHAPVAAALHPAEVVGNDTLAQWISNQGEPSERHLAPISTRAQQFLDETIAPAMFDTERHLETMFDRFDWAWGTLLADLTEGRTAGHGPWIPGPVIGSFGWRRRYRLSPAGRWAELIEWAGAPEIGGTLVPGDADRRERVFEQHAEAIQRAADSWW